MMDTVISHLDAPSRDVIMKIKDIQIENFRSIGNLTIENADPKMNLIVGVNGSGKTSVLDSLAIALSWMIARMKSPSSKGVTPADKDIRTGSKNPCSIMVMTDVGVSWAVRKSRTFSARKKQLSYKTDLGEITLLAEKIVAGAEKGGSVPVLMYYPVERAIATVPVNLHKAEPVIWDVYNRSRGQVLDPQLISGNQPDKSPITVLPQISRIFTDFGLVRTLILGIVFVLPQISRICTDFF